MHCRLQPQDASEERLLKAAMHCTTYSSTRDTSTGNALTQVQLSVPAVYPGYPETAGYTYTTPVVYPGTPRCTLHGY